MSGDEKRPPRLRVKFADRTLFQAFDLYYGFQGLRFRIAREASELEACHQIVRDTFHRQGYFPSAKTALKTEPDEADVCTFIGTHLGEPVGTIRIVSGNKLPVDRFFNLQWPEHVDRQQTAEMGRFCVSDKHRKYQAPVAVGLLRQAVYYSMSKGLRWWVGCCPALLLFAFQRYFPTVTTVKELPLQASHHEYRRGREDYFDSQQRIKIFLIDVNDVAFAPVAKKMIQNKMAWAKARKSNSHRRRAA